MSLPYGRNFTADGEPEDVPAVEATRQLRPVLARNVKPRRLRWLWDNRIVLGGLTLIAGREGLGKSTVAGDLVAQVTRGELEGEHHGTPGTVVYITSEDSREFTVVPRLIAARADLDRVLFVDAHTADGTEDRVVLPLDLHRLEDLIVEYQVTLVVLDAATSVMDGRLDGDRDRQMRQALEPVGHVANRTGAAVVGIVHFGKRESSDTGKLILGSIAWSQVARSVLAVARDDESGALIISGTKSNLAAGDTPSLEVRIVDTTVETTEGDAHVGRVEWAGETLRHARDLLAPQEDGSGERTERDEAAAWLRGYLTDPCRGGAASFKDIRKAAAADDISERTLRRARERLGIEVNRTGFGQGSVWSLPESLDPSRPHSGQSGQPSRARTDPGRNGRNGGPYGRNGLRVVDTDPVPGGR